MRRLYIFLIVMLVLAACAAPPQAAEPTVTPSPEVSPTDEVTLAPSPTLAQRSTLPPTWTPGAEIPTVTSAPTNIPGPTSTVDPSVPVLPTVPPEVCDAFGPDVERTPRNYVFGEDVTVYWTPAEGAELYYVALTDESARVVFEDYTNDTSYTFAWDQFQEGTLYGWQAHPISSLGHQMCLDEGAELFPEQP